MPFSTSPRSSRPMLTRSDSSPSSSRRCLRCVGLAALTDAQLFVDDFVPLKGLAMQASDGSKRTPFGFDKLIGVDAAKAIEHQCHQRNDELLRAREQLPASLEIMSGSLRRPADQRVHGRPTLSVMMPLPDLAFAHFTDRSAPLPIVRPTTRRTDAYRLPRPTRLAPSFAFRKRLGTLRAARPAAPRSQTTRTAASWCVCTWPC